MADKSRERLYLALLRDALTDFPSGEIISCETPDFLVRSADKIVGVEFTSFHLPPSDGEKPHQEVQALKDRIVSRAEILHDAAGGLALYVSVFFHSRAMLKKSSVEQLATSVADSVARVCRYTLPRASDVRVDWSDLPEQVVDIVVRRSINGSDRLWHADAGGWVTPIVPDHIKEVLRAKMKMQATARTRCDELWLVVVNDLFSRAAQAELTPSTVDASFDHPFDRLLWLIPHVPRVIALNASPAA